MQGARSNLQTCSQKQQSRRRLWLQWSFLNIAVDIWSPSRRFVTNRRHRGSIDHPQEDPVACSMAWSKDPRESLWGHSWQPCTKCHSVSTAAAQLYTAPTVRSHGEPGCSPGSSRCWWRHPQECVSFSHLCHSPYHWTWWCFDRCFQLSKRVILIVWTCLSD